MPCTRARLIAVCGHGPSRPTALGTERDRLPAARQLPDEPEPRLARPLLHGGSARGPLRAAQSARTKPTANARSWLICL